MKTFHEWLEDKNLKENMADWTPGFIRKPMQNMGLMGRTTDEEEALERRRYLKSPQYAAMKKAEEEKERREHEKMMASYTADRIARGTEEIRKKKEEEARQWKEKKSKGLVYDHENKQWRLPEVGKRQREDWPYGG